MKYKAFISKTLYILSTVFLASAPLISAPKSSEPPKVTRAAFDLGSGKFKLLVAEVQGKKVHVKYSKMLSVSLGSDFAESKDQSLSVRVQKAAMKALQKLKKDADAHGATEHKGIATAIFRAATNGEDLLNNLSNETGVDLQIISQEKEGVIGFNTAAALCPEIKEENLVSWDTGSASFQIVAKDGDDYQVYEGPLGNSLVSKAFMEEVRNTPFTMNSPLNPISYAECQALNDVVKTKMALPVWLEEKLKDPNTVVVTIGDNDVYTLAAKDTGKITMGQARDLINKMTDKSNKELEPYTSGSNPETALTRAILMYSIMEKFGIPEFRIQYSTGSTIGLLMDQDFWS